ncbi:MAG: hypothetical protein ACI8XD_001276 [Thermoproteota archaeon]|jgi:hypothetical protein
MQLAQAIDAWVDAHGASLSALTRRDIEHIQAAVIEVGWHELPHDEVDREVREDIIDEATRTGTLGGSAITEFLGVVVGWAGEKEAKPRGDEEALVPTGARHAQDESDDDESDDDDHDDEYDDDHDDDDDDDSEYEYESDDEYEYDDDGYDDDGYDDDHDPEDWVGYLSTAQDGDDFTGLPPENETAADTETAAASSFFNAIDSSTPADDDLVVVNKQDDSSPETTGGVFSAAAEHVQRKPLSGIDWITVAYFTVAAICFALVIYFYLSSK